MNPIEVPYELKAPGFALDRTGLYLPAEVAKARKRPIAIDLFCGAGGFSLGFIQAGWEVIAGVEYDTSCALTYTANLGTYPMRFVWIEPGDEQRMERELERELKRYEKEARARGSKLVRGFQTGAHRPPDRPGVPFFFLGDVRKLDGRTMLEIMGLKQGDVDCVMGGPPCQGFSRAGQQRVMDPRNSLVFEFARLVLEIQPKTMVMENVPDIIHMVTPEGVNVVDAFCRILSDGGFAAYDALKGQLLGHPERKGAVRQTANRNDQGRVLEAHKSTGTKRARTIEQARSVEQLEFTA